MSDAVCTQCMSPIVSEDAVYDSRESQYFCDEPCFYDWVDDNADVVTDFYLRLNISGG